MKTRVITACSHESPGVADNGVGKHVKQEETFSGLAQVAAKAEAISVSILCRARSLRLRHD